MMLNAQCTPRADPWTRDGNRQTDPFSTKVLVCFLLHFISFKFATIMSIRSALIILAVAACMAPAQIACQASRDTGTHISTLLLPCCDVYALILIPAPPISVSILPTGAYRGGSHPLPRHPAPPGS
jgi:hypothetical protein